MICRIARILSPKMVRELGRCITATPQWFFVAAVYAKIRSLRRSFVFKTRQGFQLRVDDRDELTTVWHVYFSGEYSVPEKTVTILDLGANIGAFAVWAAEKFPVATIWSIEPFPATFDRLVDNVRRNALSERVQCMNIAVAGHDGEVRFDAAEGKRSYCRTILTEADQSPAINVPSRSLKTLLNELNLTKLDCLKMDVEGAEYDILLGADSETLGRIRVITMEYHDESKTPPLWSHLERCGFQCLRQESAGWSGLATFVRS